MQPTPSRRGARTRPYVRRAPDAATARASNRPTSTGGFGEVDLEARVDAKLGVLRQFGALIPGQRAAQLLRERGDGSGMASLTASAPCPASAGPLWILGIPFSAM